MKKSELSKLTPIKATHTMMRKAKEQKPIPISWDKKRYTYKPACYIRCSTCNEILRVSIYYTEYMRMGADSPIFDIFIDPDKRDFISYNYQKKVWSEATIERLNYPRYICFDSFYSSRESNKVIRKKLNTKEGGYNGIREWQDSVRKEQLDARHKKTTDPWDEIMNKVPQKPKGFDRWAEKYSGLEEYIFYDYTKKGATSGYCSWCEKEVPIKNPKHNKMGKCPCCGHEIIFKAKGRFNTIQTTREKCYLLQKYSDTKIVIRKFWLYKKYTKNGSFSSDDVKSELYIFESRRSFFDSETNSGNSYYYGDYCHREFRWIFNEIFQPIHRSYFWSPDYGNVYPKNVKQISTVIPKTGLAEFIKSKTPVNPELYLRKYMTSPWIEQLSKSGLCKLASEFISEYNLEIDGEPLKPLPAKSLAKSWCIDDFRLKRLKENNGGWRFLEWLRQEKEHKLNIPDNVISWMCKNSVQPCDLNFIIDRMSVVQIKNYLEKQQKSIGLPIKEIIGTWKDYLAMATRLNIDTNKEIVFRVNKLKQRHDELVKLCGDKEMALRAGDVIKNYPDIESVLGDVKERYQFENDDFAIIIPRRIEDILKESTALSLCIGKSDDRYFERIATRESYLAFLRRKADIEKPWYLIEVEPGGQLRQKRTFFDKQDKDLEEAKQFLSSWQLHIQKQLTQEDIERAKESERLRLQEFKELRSKKAKIWHGDLAGQLLADVLEADFTEVPTKVG